MDVDKCLFAVTVLILVGKSAGLQCFQCSGSGPDSACETDLDAMAEARTNGGPFSKNCSIENQQFCVIELSHNRGKLSTFIRDCSDGMTFSFDKIPRLQNILPFNQTTCATYGTSGTVVCISLCRTAFCNGPQNSGSVNAAYSYSAWHVILLVFSLQIIHNFHV